MGACISSASDDGSIHGSSAGYALVVSVKGQLSRHPTPVFVSEVLLRPSSSFLCNSDKLYYDHHIAALGSEDELDAGQIYFILPKTMLGTRLTASHMASLALKASLALDHSNTSTSSPSQMRRKRKNKKNGGGGGGSRRVSPMVLMETSQVNVVVEELIGDDGFGVAASIRRTRRRHMHSSKIGRKGGVGSFRLQLSTIDEGNACDDEQLARS